MRSKVFTLFTTLLAALTVSGGFAQQTEYQNVRVPSTVQVIVAASAGGSTDAMARLLMPYWESAINELTGQRVSTVIRNMPGAGTEIGATALVNANPDGSTIGVINLPHIPLLQAARDTAFDPWLENFIPLGLDVIDPNVVILGDRSPYESLEEAIEAARQNPGSVVVGSQGPLSDDQLALYALEQVTGATFTYIPFEGGAGANRALLGGEIDLTVGNVFDYIQVEGSARDAAIFGNERYDLIPDVPTVEEALGVLPGELAAARGYAAPAGLPEDLLEVYREAFRIAFDNADYQAEARERNITLVTPRIGDEFGAFMAGQESIVSSLLSYFIEAGYLD